MDQIKKSTAGEKCGLPLILAVGLVARLHWFWYNPSLWNDEASLANNLIKYSFSKIAVTPLDDAQAAPPGYLLLEKLFGLAGNYSEHSLRFLSLLCGIAALFLFADLTRRVLSGAGRLLAVAAFSLSGPLIYHSGEVKQYQMEVLAAVVLLWLAVRFHENLTGRQALGVGGVGILCVVCSNSAIFVLSGAFGLMAARFFLLKQYRMLAHAGVVLGLAGSAFLAYYFLILRLNPNVAQLKAGWAPHFAPWPVSSSGVLWYVRTAFFAMVNPFGLSLDLDLPFLPQSVAAKYAVALSVGGVGLFILGVVEFWRRDRYLGGLILAALVTTLGASLLGQYPLNERLIVFLAPVFLLTVGKGAELAGGVAARKGVRWGVRFLVALTSVYLAINFTAKITHPAWFGGVEKYSQAREAIHYIAQARRKDDRVYLMWNAVRFYDYYNFREKLDWPLDVGTDPRRQAHSLDDIGADARREIQASLEGENRVWFLLGDVLSPVEYRDQNGVVHQSATPTATIFKAVLSGNPYQAPEKFTGHAVEVYTLPREGQDTTGK